MIAKTASAPTFAPTARYLAGRGVGTDPARVAWTASRNLPTDDPTLSADLMQATASQNLHVESPAYQLTLSFAPEDHPTRALMEETADRVLSELGLADHQALLVAHHDRQHQHIHLLINRVHPETFAPWDRWHDHTTLAHILAAVETEHNLRRVPARDAQIAARATTPSPDRQITRPPQAEGRPLITRLRELLPEIRAAQTWHELRDQLRSHDITLEPRAHGLVFVDGSGHVKASRVAADTSLSRLEARLGPYPAAIREPDQPTPQALAPYEIARTTDAATQRLRQAEWAVERAARSGDDLYRALSAAFVYPGAVRSILIHYHEAHAAGSGPQALRDRPEQFGALAVVGRRHLFGLWRSIDDQPARMAANEAAALLKEWTEHSRHARDLLRLDPDASVDAMRTALAELRTATTDLAASLAVGVAAAAVARTIERTAADLLLGRDQPDRAP